MLTDVSFDVQGIVCHEVVPWEQTEPTFLADIWWCLWEDVCWK